MDKKPKKLRPNNLKRLMDRDGIRNVDIAKIWDVKEGDVSQRVAGEVGITPARAKLLEKAFGWTYSDIYDVPADKSPDKKPEKKITNDTSQTDLAEMFAIKTILKYIFTYRPAAKKELCEDLSQGAVAYRENQLEDAAKLMDDLCKFVAGDIPPKKPPELQKLLELAPQGRA